MRLLPRSRRGTWLLAGAMWCAACAGLWWALPLASQSTMTLPIDDALIGFGPHGERSLVRRHVGTAGEWGNHAVYNLDVVAVSSSQTIETIARYCEHVRPLSESPDGSVWLVHVGGRYRPRLLRMNIGTLDVVELPEQLSQIAHTWPPAISPDGRWAIFANVIPHLETADGNGALIWDLASNSLHATIRNLGAPFAFSPDGRYLAGCEICCPHCIRMIDMQTHESRNTFVGTQGKTTKDLHFSVNGHYLAAESLRIPRRGQPDAQEAACWNVETGERIFRGTQTFTRFAASGHTIVGFDWVSRELQAFNLRSGIALDVSVVEPKPLFADWDVAPNARTMVSFQAGIETSAVELLLARLGLKWPFADEDAKVTVRLYDTDLFRELNVISASAPPAYRSDFDPRGILYWIDGGQLLAVQTDMRRNEWRVYQMPPRKSLTWFAAGAALLALPISLVAWRRTRKLRAA